MSEPKRPRRRRPAPPEEVATPETTAAEAAEVADAAEAAARARPRNGPLIIAGVVAAALVVGWLATRASGPPPTVDAKGQEIKIVAERDALAEGTIVQVYFRTVPPGNRFAAQQAYTQSFPVTAEKSPFGGGAITLKQLLAGFAAAKVPGKIIHTWAVDKKADTAIGDWRSSGATGLFENQVVHRHVVDADGRALLFVDVETWAPGDPERDCQQDPNCTGWGKCTGREGNCVATTDADCAKSHRCKEDGRCVARDGECKVGDDAACGRLEACTKDGRCTARDGTCVATSAETCAKSERCKDLRADEECVVAMDSCMRRGNNAWKPSAASDCAKTSGCTESGLCGFRDGKCVAADDAGCAASGFCRSLGLCGRLDDRCAARTAAHCEASSQCKSIGKCGLIEDECFPTKDEHCTASESCKTFKQCERADMKCKEP